jgi:hypothetical protein
MIPTAAALEPEAVLLALAVLRLARVLLAAVIAALALGAALC